MIDLEQAAQTIRRALEAKHPLVPSPFDYLPEVMRDFLALHDATPDEIRKEMRLPKDGARCTIAMQIYVTSKRNLVGEFVTSNEDSERSLTVSRIMGHYAPHRLFQIADFYELGGNNPFWTSWLKLQNNSEEYAQCAELWSTFIQFAAAVLDSFVAKVATLGRLEDSHARLRIVPSGRFTNEPRLALIDNLEASRFRLPGESFSPVEMLTGIFEENLLRQLLRPESDGQFLDDWRKVVVAVGGKDPAQTADWKQVALTFFREHDYHYKEVQRKKELENQAAQRATRRDKAREVLKSLELGSRNVWGKAFAAQMGMHPTDVKRWIVKNLPDIAATMYPPKAAKA